MSKFSHRLLKLLWLLFAKSISSDDDIDADDSSVVYKKIGTVP